jgi:hypothetical protein
MEHEMRKHIDKFNKFRLSENLNISDVRSEFNYDDLIDLLQTIKAISNIENNTHPTIKNGSDKHIEFKNWYEYKYIKSGLVDEIINHFNT